MKKLVFAIVAVAAVSFASCGGNANNTETCDSACDSACYEEEKVPETAEEKDTTALGGDTTLVNPDAEVPAEVPAEDVEEVAGE